MRFILVVCLLTSLWGSTSLPRVNAFLEQVRWTFNVHQQSCYYFNSHAALYANSSILIKINCDSSQSYSSTLVNVGYVVRSSPCLDEYIGPELSDYSTWYYHCPAAQLGDFGYQTVQYLKSKEIQLKCNHFVDLTELAQDSSFKEENVDTDLTKDCHSSDTYCDSVPNVGSMWQEGNQFDQFVPHADIKSGHRIGIPADGVYLLVLHLWSASKDTFNATVEVGFKSPSDKFLTALDYPLMPFYGTMFVLYLFMACFWFAFLVIRWRDLLRIQIYLSAIILLGMIEKACLFGSYRSFDAYGYVDWHFSLFVVTISCLKRTMARVQFLIVSSGYEIVKHSLGDTRHKVILVNILYLVLSFFDSIIKIQKMNRDQYSQRLMAGIPLALLDSFICYWIFSNLMQTIKVLTLRRNHSKLRLFNYFSHVLVSSVFASVCFIIWQLQSHRLTLCLKDWNHVWIDEAFWHVLFSIILVSIMILWRPTNNSQRYAFTPLVNDEDLMSDDDDQALPMDMKNVQRRELTKKIENSSVEEVLNLSEETKDNLKWIEENISKNRPLSTFMDSDEDLMETRFELSKMQ